VRRKVPTLLAGVAVWLALTTAAEAGCDSASLRQSMTEADAAFLSMDADAFGVAVDALHETLSCVASALSTEEVAAYHRTRALAAFFAGDDLSAVASFEAAVSTAPSFELAEDIAPIGHPLRARLEEARETVRPADLELQRPAEGWLNIDGVRTLQAPSARPFVFQRFRGDGTVAETRYVAPGSPMPIYPFYSAAPPPVGALGGPAPAVPPPTTVSSARVPRPAPTEPLPRGTLVPRAVGITLDVVAAGLYGLAFLSRSNYDRAVETGTEDRIRSAHLTTNALVGGSIGAAVVGTSLVVATF
jgi:hypothetical protein